MKFAKGAFTLALMAWMVAFVSMAVAQDDAPKPKHTIKEVMVNIHKNGVLKKVLAGEASDEEKAMLLDNYISMVESTPPKGDMQSWHLLAGKATLAAAKVAVGREEGLTELKAATNCAACHKAHKAD